jgi:DNA-binding MarR family transcriptional regulator
VVEFSMLSLVKSNPGITSSHVCQHLRLLPPNVVILVNKLIRLGFIYKQQHLHDRRAAGLYMTEEGLELVTTLEARIQSKETEHLHQLTTTERQQLVKLLKKTYA